MRLQLTTKIANRIVGTQWVQYSRDEYMRTRTKCLYRGRCQPRWRVYENDIEILEHCIAQECAREPIPNVLPFITDQPSDHFTVLNSSKIVEGRYASGAADALDG